MSYNTSEQGAATSQPVELYDFFAQTGEHWRYTSSSEIQNHLGNDYTPDTIDRKAIEITENQFKNVMDIKLGRNNEFAIQYIASPPESRIGLSIFRYQGTDYVLYWSGSVQLVTFDKNGIPSIKATMNTSNLVGVSKRRRCQILCDHALYDSGCDVNREAYKVEGTLLTVVGKTLTSNDFATKADGWFAAGQIKIGNACRLIKSHVGATITISRPIYGAEIGNSFTAYAGCDHAYTTCRGKFYNAINSGDHRFLPTKNPTNGVMGYNNKKIES